jgi:rhodanese-related sulfurtransferase
MGHLLFLFSITASLLLGACGSNVEESPDTSTAEIEKSGGTPVEVSGDAPVEESTKTSISAEKLAYRIQAGSRPFILDIRSREDFARGHIPGATNIPQGELSTRLTELPTAKSDEIVIVQARDKGRRAQTAEATLRGSGYSNVRHLAGQLRSWYAAKLPIE